MGLKEISFLLANYGGVLVFVFLLLSVFFYKKLDNQRKAMVFYLCLMLSIEVLLIVVGLSFGSNQMILPFACFAELSFFFFLFKRHLFKQKHPIVTVIGSLGLAYIAGEFFYNFVYHQVTTLEYQPYAKVVDNFVIIVFSLTYLLEKMTTYNESRWDNFALNMALLINFTLSTIFFLPFNFMVNESSDFKFYFWIFNVFLVYTFYAFLIIDIIMNARKNGSLKKQV